MKYVMKQALLSFGDDFSVKDEHGRDVFYFDGQVLSIGKKIIVQERNKQEVARIQQRFFRFSPTYSLRQGKDEIATIRKKLFTFRPSFVVDVPGPDDITVVGRLIEHDYKFLRNGKQIAHCSKRWFTGKDTYGIEIDNAADVLLVLSAAVVIDLVCHPKRDSTFGNSRKS
ncbi:LURP-one-related family protein [bacterium]|nr:LURP-one-related family protein [bacterium]